jgi:hypothetical protein
MTISDQSSATKQERRREPWRRLSERLGVSTRTLDRWAQAGIVPPPEYINGRKYGDPDITPQHDHEPEGEAAE